jgi:hypothetical protein
MRAIRSAVVLLAAAAALSGCGGDGGNPRGDAVNAYIDRVNSASASLVDQNVAINTAFRRFSTSGNTAAELRALVHAQAALERAHRRVAALSPPADARRLHRDLVRMLGLEAAVARNMVWAARYTPKFDRALAPLAPAGKRFTSDLAAATGWDAQADAFQAYRTALLPVLARLNRLAAPPELRASLAAERSLLRRSIALSREAEDALRARNGNAASARVAELSGLASGRLARAAHAQQTTAVKAYNRRLRTIAGLRLRVDRERLRLVGDVG